jgi:hypothetical protein
LVGNRYKQLEVGNITPMPITNDASFTIDVYQEGVLTVELFDLTGQMVSSILNTYTSANRRYDINMQLGFLSSGIYNVMISINDDVVMRPIIINR